MVSPEDEMTMPFDKTVQVKNDHAELFELLNELQDFDLENETLKMQNQTLRLVTCLHACFTVLACMLGTVPEVGHVTCFRSTLACSPHQP